MLSAWTDAVTFYKVAGLLQSIREEYRDGDKSLHHNKENKSRGVWRSTSLQGGFFGTAFW
jgi:hypothetical protein